MNQFLTTAIDYQAVAPMLIIFVAGLIGVLVEALVPRERRHEAQVAVALVAIISAFLVLVLFGRDHHVITAGGSVIQDGPAWFLQATLLVLGFMALLDLAERFGGTGPDSFTPMGAATPGSQLEAQVARLGWSTGEIFPLVLFSLSGMMLFVAAGDLITMFVALEVLSLPLYLLTGLARRRRLLSQEAALKYFLLGAFASAFFLFGAALLYGYAGSADLAALNAAVAQAPAGVDGLLLPGTLFVLVGLLFKVGAVPFHSWTPDVYQGAPTPVTGFMAACTKVAAFGAMLRFVYVGVGGDRWSWSLAIAIVAVLTMVVGALLSYTQTDIKRLLAYGSIAHAGFILVAVLAFDVTGVTGTMVYLVAYGLATVAAFALISMVRSSAGESAPEATQLDHWAGLGKKHPWIAAAFAICLMSMAGLPLTMGFVAKFGAFAPAIAHGGTLGVVLAVVGVLASMVTLAVYFRLIVLMFFTEAKSATLAVVPSATTAAAIVAGVVLTVWVGILPGALIKLAADNSQFLLR